ncbi:MAG: nitrogen fixation protein FixH [Limnohabitans sp.]
MNASNNGQAPQRRWWSFGHVWLLIAGPAIVVVAGFFTFYLAARSPDPVLSTHVQAQDTGQDISQAPAVQARNHAATGQLPAQADKKP